MRRRPIALAIAAMGWAGIVGACASVAIAQAEPSPDQLRRMYADTLHQLQEAQDRKNQLAAENDQLRGKIASLQKQLEVAQASADDASRQVGELARRTFAERSEFAAWQEFLAHDPRLARQWGLFLRDSAAAAAPGQLSDELGANWPWAGNR
jgi:septal ring factor EnvC (AmiA/AmiB activator)